MAGGKNQGVLYGGTASSHFFISFEDPCFHVLVSLMRKVA